MKLNRFGFLILGVFFLYLGIHDFIIGETLGFGGGKMTSSTILYTQRPIEFTLAIIFQLFIGGFSIKKGLSTDSKGKSK